jgi:hypothetical protein
MIVRLTLDSELVALEALIISVSTLSGFYFYLPTVFPLMQQPRQLSLSTIQNIMRAQ